MKEKTTKFQTGDIYLVRFHPSYGQELKRYRPAVIISSQINQIDPRFTLIAPLTTNTQKQNKKHELLIQNPSLEKNSLLLTWYLKTIDIVRLEKKIGRLSPSDIKKLKSNLQKLF